MDKSGVMIMNNLNIDFKNAIEHGIIDYADVWEKSENMKRTEYLEKHPHPITLGKDGYCFKIVVSFCCQIMFSYLFFQKFLHLLCIN